MRKVKILSYMALLLAEGIAILNDTFFYNMRQQAAVWYRTDLVFAYKLIPLCIMGGLLAFGISYGKAFNLFSMFLGLIIVNIALLLINHFALILFQYDGIIFMIGFAAGGSIAHMTANKVNLEAVFPTQKDKK